MSTKWKAILIAVAVISLIVFGYFAGAQMSGGDLSKAKKDIDRLTGEINGMQDSFATKSTEWEEKEKGYKQSVKNLNNRLAILQKEKNVLDVEIKKIKKERSEIVVPDNPDDVVKQFRDAGFRSCTRIKGSR